MALRLVGMPNAFPLGRRGDYISALRSAVTKILSDGPREIHIFHGKQRVAVCERQYRNVGRRGGKFSVLCSGEKPKRR